MFDGGVRCELSGSDYLLDLISEVELPSKMDTMNSYFIVSSENVSEIKSRRVPASRSGRSVDGFNFCNPVGSLRIVDYILEHLIICNNV